MIFLDTTFIIAFYIDSDFYHDRALALYEIIEHETVLINSTVLLEVFNTFKENKYKINLDDLYSTFKNFYIIDYLNPEDYKSSLDKLNYYNQSINYNDCTILSTMEKYKVTNIASFDSHFDKINGITRYYL